MYTVQVVQHLLMKTAKLFVQTDDSVALAFTAPFLLRAAGAILTLIIFFCSSVTISFYGTASQVMKLLMKLFPSRADRAAAFVYGEVYCSVRVIPVGSIGALLLEHRELHIFFHAVFFTVESLPMYSVSLS